MQRELAYQILCSSLIGGQYANILLKNSLKSIEINQRAFITELVYGVLRNYLFLNYQFTAFLKGKTKEEDKIILAMAAYEKYFLKHPDYVYTNEYVKLAKNRIAKGFINAVIRKLPAELQYADAEYINYSLPKWIYDMLKAQYDTASLQYYLLNLNQEPELYYRLNPKKCTFDKLKLPFRAIDNRMFTSENNLINSDEFRKGYFYVQDYNGSFIVDYLDLQADDLLLDACSAPGSKLFNALETVMPKNVYANDLYAHRLKLIQDKATILGYEGINYLNTDISIHDSRYDNFFDKILIDAPCSGLGVIKRKPDLKYHIRPEDIDDIMILQSKILDTAAAYLKSTGILVYSTCTINTKENGRMIQSFIQKHPDFELLCDEMLQKETNSDYFYVAKLLKRR